MSKNLIKDNVLYLHQILNEYYASNTNTSDIKKIPLLSESILDLIYKISEESLLPSLLFLSHCPVSEKKYRLQNIGYELISERLISTIDKIIFAVVDKIKWFHINYGKKICSAQLLGGDLHNDGNVPIKITYEEENRDLISIVIKHGDPSAHELLDETLEIICDCLNFPGKLIPKVESKSSGYYSKPFAEQKNQLTEIRAPLFFYAYGIIISIADFLQISDLHFENIIPSSNYPVLIDVETIFSSAVRNFPKWSYINSNLLFTNTSPISQIASRRFIESNLQFDENDNPIIRFSIEKCTSDGLIYDNNNKLHEIKRFLDHINQGARAADDALRKSKNNISLLNESINRDHTYRYIILPTAYYKTLQLQLWNPGLSISLEKRIELIKGKLFNIHKKFLYDFDATKIIEIEIEDLLNFDIPFFSINGKNGDLLNRSIPVYEKIGFSSNTLMKYQLNRIVNKKNIRKLI